MTLKWSGNDAVHQLSLDGILFFLLVGTFPRSATNPFEKRQAATDRFLKEFRADLGNVSANRKKRISLA
jgi:hypothetical protein